MWPHSALSWLCVMCSYRDCGPLGFLDANSTLSSNEKQREQEVNWLLIIFILVAQW